MSWTFPKDALKAKQAAAAAALAAAAQVEAERTRLITITFDAINAAVEAARYEAQVELSDTVDAEMLSSFVAALERFGYRATPPPPEPRLGFVRALRISWEHEREG